MAYVVARKGRRYEARESEATPRRATGADARDVRRVRRRGARAGGRTGEHARRRGGAAALGSQGRRAGHGWPVGSRPGGSRVARGDQRGPWAVTDPRGRARRHVGRGARDPSQAHALGSCTRPRWRGREPRSPSAARRSATSSSSPTACPRPRLVPSRVRRELRRGRRQRTAEDGGCSRARRPCGIAHVGGAPDPGEGP